MRLTSFIIGTIDDTRIVINHPSAHAKRLQDQCFRRSDKPGRPNLQCAGNFRAVASFGELYRLVRLPFDKRIIQIIEEMQRQTRANPERARSDFRRSFAIEARTVVGWSRTTPYTPFAVDQFRDFKPNRHSTAKCVKLSTSVLAPLTNHVTFNCVFMHLPAQNDWLVNVESIYPGVDIGKLDGNITERSGRAFFELSHPGAPYHDG